VAVANGVTAFLTTTEDAAFRKVCKIHQNLPHGGILVFLTGKQEIVRMVNRLRRALVPRQSAAKTAHCPFIGSNDVATPRTDITYSSGSGPRDLDDDEVDGDLLIPDERDDDFEDTFENSIEALSKEASNSVDEDKDDGKPKDVLVLPLYSMLSAEEQARVFGDVPEGCRLIVVSTNIGKFDLVLILYYFALR
jgi:ATP-dependent RNA helicase DHX37/DHR1